MSRSSLRSSAAVCLLAALLLASASAASPPQHSFPYGQCTYWAYLKRPFIVDQSALKTDAHDWNAYAWAQNAQAAGFPVRRTPAVGAIAVWPAHRAGTGKYGHVAYVERVLSGGDYTVSEMNWNGQSRVHHRLVAPDAYVRFIYRLPDEARPSGSGALTGLDGTRSGNEEQITITLSGPATVLINTTGPQQAHEEILELPGTTTLSLASLAGQATTSGNYTVRVVLAGAGGSYSYLTVQAA